MLKGCLCALLAGALLVAPAVAAVPSIKVIVNGRRLPSQAVQAVDQKTYVSVRAVGDALGAYVTANQKEQTVTVTTLLRQAVLHIDDVHAMLNGQPVVLSAPPRRRGDRILLPLRALADVFGAAITYDPRSHTTAVKSTTQGLGSGPSPATLVSTKTLSGTVSAVNTSNQSSIQFLSGGQSYTVSVPAGSRIAFRDVRGAITANGPLSSVRPGDALIVTLGPGGELISLADIFASITGTIAGVAGQSMVLQSGRVITADSPQVSVSIDGQPATFTALAVGDKVSVRADPVSGVVHEVVALSPAGYAKTAGAGGNGGSGSVWISSVSDNPVRPLKDGETLNVSFDGTPGGAAQFDLSDVIAGNPMRETRPGHYEGAYLVSVGTNLTDAPVLVRLSKNGSAAVAEAAAPLTIITTPPRVQDASPRAGDQINLTRPNIVVTFATVGNTGMNPDSLRLRVDGRDVTGQATRTPSFISYYPLADLPSNMVEVEVKGTDIAGNTLEYRWSFRVQK